MFMMLVTDLQKQDTTYSEELYIFQLGENHYDLRTPKNRWKLSTELKEVSGIALFDDRTMLCIQDEKGTVYFYDLKDESIKRRAVFGKSSDYEDITLVENSIYILKSNGQLFTFDITQDKEPKIKIINTSLSAKNNTEGLIFDSWKNRLLIACKDSPYIGKYEKKGRAIYSFDLTEGKLDEKPAILISNEKFNDALKTYGLDVKKHKTFQPSGIAIHPSTGRIVIICSVGKILIVLDRNGNIENLVPLDSDLFIQPEGISFSSDGDLYIASEGKLSSGYILKF